METRAASVFQDPHATLKNTYQMTRVLSRSRPLPSAVESLHIFYDGIFGERQFVLLLGFVMVQSTDFKLSVNAKPVGIGYAIAAKCRLLTDDVKSSGWT
jgi:hypothetical protein